MENYIVKMKHDAGTVRIQINASSEEAAIEAVLKIERAPRSAVMWVRLA